MRDHFKFELVPKGRWRKYSSKRIEAGKLEDRYHLVSNSYSATSLILADAGGTVAEEFFKNFPVELDFSRSNRRVSIMIDDEGTTRFGYRFLKLPADRIQLRFIESLNDIANQWFLLSEAT